MESEERDELTLFLTNRYDEILVDLETAKDAQLRMNSQIETLTNVVFGLMEQISKAKAKLESMQKANEGAWPIGWSSLPAPRSGIGG